MDNEWFLNLETMQSNCRQLCTSDSRGNMSVLCWGRAGGRGGAGGTTCAGMAALVVFTQEVMSYLHMRVTPTSYPPPGAERSYFLYCREKLKWLRIIWRQHCSEFYGLEWALFSLRWCSNVTSLLTDSQRKFPEFPSTSEFQLQTWVIFCVILKDFWCLEESFLDEPMSMSPIINYFLQVLM